MENAPYAAKSYYNAPLPRSMREAGKPPSVWLLLSSGRLTGVSACRGKIDCRRSKAITAGSCGPRLLHWLLHRSRSGRVNHHLLRRIHFYSRSVELQFHVLDLSLALQPAHELQFVLILQMAIEVV